MFSHFFKKNLCCFIMTFTLDHVKSLLKSNLVYELRNAQSVICDRFKKSPRVTQTKLFESVTVTSQVNFFSNRRIYIHKKKIQFSITEINIEIKTTATAVIKNELKYFLMSERVIQIPVIQQSQNYRYYALYDSVKDQFSFFC